MQSLTCPTSSRLFITIILNMITKIKTRKRQKPYCGFGLQNHYFIALHSAINNQLVFILLLVEVLLAPEISLAAAQLNP